MATVVTPTTNKTTNEPSALRSADSRAFSSPRLRPFSAGPSLQKFRHSPSTNSTSQLSESYFKKMNNDLLALNNKFSSLKRQCQKFHVYAQDREDQNFQADARGYKETTNHTLSSIERNVREIRSILNQGKLSPSEKKEESKTARNLRSSSLPKQRSTILRTSSSAKDIITNRSGRQNSALPSGQIKPKVTHPFPTRLFHASKPSLFSPLTRGKKATPDRSSRSSFASTQSSLSDNSGSGSASSESSASQGKQTKKQNISISSISNSGVEHQTSETETVDALGDVRESSAQQELPQTYPYYYGNGWAEPTRKICFFRTNDNPQTISAQIFATLPGEVHRISTLKGDQIKVEGTSMREKLKLFGQRVNKKVETVVLKPDRQFSKLTKEEQDDILNHLRPNGRWRIEITNGFHDKPSPFEKVESLYFFPWGDVT